MKKILLFALTAVMACSVFLGGCFISGINGADGQDGKDGQDVSVYDLYEAAKSIEGNENLTLDEFLKQYLSYDSQTLEQAAALQASINRSLLSGVSVLSRFTYNDTLAYAEGGVLSFGGGTAIGKPDYHLFALGAGVIVDLDKETGDAYVVTNCHVIYDDSSKETFSKEVYLFLYGQDTEGVNFDIDGYCTYNGKRVYYKADDGNEYYLPDQQLLNDEGYSIPATVIGASVTYDIALLKVSASDVLKNSPAAAASFANAEDVFMGQQVYAVGNPRGYGMSATAGIISKDSEEIVINMSEVDEDSVYNYRVIRTDAAINGGNSGGGLYNASGELIGIVNSKSVSDDIDNMGYALPASNVKRLWLLMRDAYLGGNNKSGVNRAFPVADYEIAGTSSYYNKTTGLVEIEEKVKVIRGGGNLQNGDIIKNVKILNGESVVEDLQVTRMYHFEDALLSVRNGYNVTVTVSRGGNDVEVDMGYSFTKLS